MKRSMGMGEIRIQGAGFTLIELMVTTAIFLILTTTVILNYPRFNSNISVGKVAREMALTIREAQAFGLAVREFESVSPSAFGVFFHKDNTQEMIMFVDKDEDGKYRQALGCSDDPDAECIEKFILKGNVSIVDICVNSTGLDGDERCIGDGTDYVDIIFERANPDSKIDRNNEKTFDNATANVIIQSNNYADQDKSIRVWITGQISVEDVQN